jgi:hypothetical protein
VNTNKFKHLIVLVALCLSFAITGIWVFKQESAIFAIYMIVTLAICSLYTWNNFFKKPRFSGTLTDWIPRGFSIQYEGALQTPLLNLTGQEDDQWINVFFGNATINISLQSRVVMHSHQTKRRDIKLLVKDGEKIVLNIGY